MPPLLLYVYPLPLQRLLPYLCELTVAAYRHEWLLFCVIAHELVLNGRSSELADSTKRRPYIKLLNCLAALLSTAAACDHSLSWLNIFAALVSLCSSLLE